LIRRPSNHRRNLIPYAALLLVLVVGAGGGYALAASKTKTITVCADKKTGLLHLHNHGKCKRGQTRVTWNQRGPQGLQGVQGPAGQPGAPAVSVWGQVATNGSLLFGQGLSVQHLSQPGTYQVTITAPACVNRSNAPVVTISDGPPSGGTFPVSWFESTGGNQFDVFTGLVSNGAVTLTDRTFTVMDACM
jgi:hypothetical protein